MRPVLKKHPRQGIIPVYFSKSSRVVLLCSAGLYNRQGSVISV